MKTKTQYQPSRYHGEEDPRRPVRDFWTPDTPDADIAADLEAGGYTRDKAGGDFPRVLAAVRAMLAGEIDGLVLTGKTGCGKTTAARAIAPHVLDRPSGCVVRFPDDPPPTDTAYTDGWLVECSNQEVVAACAPTEDDPWRKLASPRSSVLLDDMGAERPVLVFGNKTDPVALFVHEWSGEPKRGRLIATTNFDAEGIRKRYDDRVLSRLIERCGWLSMTAPDHRLARIRKF